MSWYIILNGDPRKVWNAQRKMFCCDLDADYNFGFSYRSPNGAKTVANKLSKSEKFGKNNVIDIVDRRTLFDMLGVSDVCGELMPDSKRLRWKKGKNVGSMFRELLTTSGFSHENLEIEKTTVPKTMMGTIGIRAKKDGKVVAMMSVVPSDPDNDGKVFAVPVGLVSTHIENAEKFLNGMISVKLSQDDIWLSPGLPDNFSVSNKTTISETPPVGWNGKTVNGREEFEHILSLSLGPLWVAPSLRMSSDDELWNSINSVQEKQRLMKNSTAKVPTGARNSRNSP